MTIFREQYQNEPLDFHLWPQDKIAEFWWKKALEWVCKERRFYGRLNFDDKIDKELEE